MKKLLTLLLLFPSIIAISQTWDGSSNTDWNTASNWNTNAVPVSTGNVIIPTGLVNYPKLANNVSIAGYSMVTGTSIDFNGFTLSCNGNFNITGGSFNNTNISSNIVINTTGSGFVYIANATINDHITFNHNSNGEFREGFSGANLINFDATFNIGSTGIFSLGFDSKSDYVGNVTVLRTVAGTSNIFRVGTLGVSGDLSYTNNIGGATVIGQNGAGASPIDGTINITANPPSGNHNFNIFNTSNLGTGGSINVANAGNISVKNNTLKLANFTINGFSNGSTHNFDNNSITSPITITEATTNTGPLFMSGNSITGNTVINFNSALEFREAFGTVNVFNGNFNLNTSSTGTGIIGLSYDSKSTYNGNVSIIRLGAGTTNIFRVGTVGVSGNLSYSNNAGGVTVIGQNGAGTSPISGTINITANPPSGNHNFSMFNTSNLTAGGSINVTNAGNISVKNNTLKLANFIINGFSNGGAHTFDNNVITSPITITEATTNTAPLYMSGNNITGNTIINHNATMEFREAFGAANVFNGNFQLNSSSTGTGLVGLSYDSKSTYNGNVTIMRLGAGNTNIFRVGTVGVLGNLSYTNDVGGVTVIGNATDPLYSIINGTINISSNVPTSNPNFSIYRTKSLTLGGIVNIINAGAVQIVENTLPITDLNITNYKSGGVTDVKSNIIGGNLVMTEDALNTGLHYLRGNTISGNTIITTNSSSEFREGWSLSNIFLGNATFNRNGTGNLKIAFDQPVEFYKSLYLNSSAGITFTGAVRFKGNTNGVFEQLGTQPIISMPNMIMEKTVGSTLTLNDRLEILTNVTFTTGKILCGNNSNILVLLVAATATGYSDNSFVEGMVRKEGGVTVSFTFPIGFGNKLATLTVHPIPDTFFGSTHWFAEYIPHSANSVANLSQKESSLHHISQKEYWNLGQYNTQSIEAQVTIGWNATCTNCITNTTNLRVARWDFYQDKWRNQGNNQITGNNSTGTIKSDIISNGLNPYNPVYYTRVTLASTNTDNPFNSCFSTKSGNWNDTTVWSCGRIPLATDPIGMNAGHTVAIPMGNYVAKNITFAGGIIQYLLGGTLTFYP